MGLISKKAKTSAGKPFGLNRIYGADGDHETVYMTRAWFGRLRFHLFHRGDQDPDCHDHPWGFWTFPLRSYVEEVLEERVESYWGTDEFTMEQFFRTRTYFMRHTRVVQAFRWHYRPATHKHRVLGAFIGLDPMGGVNGDVLWFPRHATVGTIPTVVWRDKPSRAWGFTKERDGVWCWVPWKTYVFDGGKDAPCGGETK